eukprot:TRINITY_DN12440_c0_g2_i3.p1 TRINITY_DN12440_c0_g2~~TRINITY_DN12440_c0_g2_i3.p1  ORF type:complete len:407 (-),score=40.84 TRINITY_DN12440_c0_g2_i3:98-1318(-)
MVRSSDHVQTTGDTKGGRGVMQRRVANQKGDIPHPESTTPSSKHNALRDDQQHLSERLNRFWYAYDVTASRLAVFRVALFLVLALDSFEQISRAYNYAHAPGGYHLPHIMGMDLLPWGPSPTTMLTCWLLQFFLALRQACGLGSSSEMIVFASTKAYTVLVSQIDNYQHHYLTVLLLIICCFISWHNTSLRQPNSTPSTTSDVWPVRLILVQLSITYCWTAITKMNPHWVSGDILPLTIGPESVHAISLFGPSALSIVSISTTALELLLCVAIHLPSQSLLRSVAFVAGVMMHCIMGSSGLRIGRFSELMVVLYLLIAPSFVITLGARLLGTVSRMAYMFCDRVSNIIPLASLSYKIIILFVVHVLAYCIIHAAGVVNLLPSISTCLIILLCLCVFYTDDGAIRRS